MTLTHPDDDPLALPLEEATVLLEPPPNGAEACDPAAQAMRALRQHMGAMGLALTLEDLGGDSQGRLLQLAGHRLQLACAPFWADMLPVAAGPWRVGSQPVHLLVGAWVEIDHGAVHFPGVLTAQELGQWLPQRGDAGPRELPLSAFHGGTDRLFSLVRLMPPAVSPLVLAIDWLAGRLAPALEAFGAELEPATAGAFRGAGGNDSDGLAALAIPLALVAGQIRWGSARQGASERFQLRLLLRGAAGRPQLLELRLEPALPGDLLPPDLALRAGSHVVSSGPHGSARPLVVELAADDQPVAIQLEYCGAAGLQLPPMAVLPA